MSRGFFAHVYILNGLFTNYQFSGFNDLAIDSGVFVTFCHSFPLHYCITTFAITFCCVVISVTETKYIPGLVFKGIVKWVVLAGLVMA